MTLPLAKLEAADPLPPAIRIRDLYKRFGQLTAVDGVSFDIAHGEFFMIVGPSGCGKTTLLRILAGLDSITSGSIEIETPNSQRPVNSMIFQGDSIFPWMTVWDNAAYGLKMRRAPASTIKEVVGHYLARTGLTRFAKYYPHQLSGGMRQRVSIARALITRPPIVLYDSPTSGLDPITSQTIISLILRLRDVYGVTALMATHRLQDGFGLANFRFDPKTKKVLRGASDGHGDPASTHFLVLREGRIYFEGTPDELMHAKDPYLQRFLI